MALRIVAVVAVIAIIAAAVMSTTDLLRPPSSITIENVGTFEVHPEDIETTRPDVFVNSHLSVFDVLVHMSKEGNIDLEYHFDEELGTHVVDSIDGKPDWWYRAWYDGGWSESNSFRMDLYPYKDGMFISVFRTNPGLLDSIHDSFREEMARLGSNDGTVIIPTVTIRGPSQVHVFDDVVVTAHDLRDDVFRQGTITAIDVIMSLGDQGEITYDMTWYEEVGSAEVRTYFITAIDGDIAHGRCGFVYEEGDEDMRFANHIHIPADVRVITSPEYELWFWICL